MIRNPFKTLRIDYLLFGSFAGFIVLLLFVITWLTYSLTVKELTGNTSFYQQKLLNELNKQVSIQLVAVERMALAISTNVDLLTFLSLKEDFYERQRTQKEIENYLSNEVYSSAIMESVELYMRDPALPAARTGAVSISRMEHLQERPWFPMIEHADFAWIGEREIATAFHESQQVISFARKIYNNTGLYQGVIVMNVVADALRQIMQGEETGGIRMLLDTGNRLITSTGNASSDHDPAPYLEQIKAGYDELDAMTDRRHDPGSGVIFVVSDVPSTDWTLIELTPRHKIIQGSFRIAMISILAGAFFILISLCFTLLLSRQFIKPIGLLTKAMSKSAFETDKMNLPTDYRNEFGLLFKGYRKFVERIQELYASLEDKYLRQRETEIQALQAMINPHFLYNTLDQINWMAIEANQREISRVLELMGSMFRIGLSNGETYIPIRHELEHIRYYLEIQQIRWGEGLHVEFDVPEAVQKLYIPKLILQPFVENAVTHGFNDRDNGNIEIRIIETEGDLLVTIRDDGSGLSPDWNTRREKPTGGYGIRNVMDRIEAYFGPAYGVEMSGGAETGTTVRVTLPRLETKMIGGNGHVEDRNRR